MCSFMCSFVCLWGFRGLVLQESHFERSRGVLITGFWVWYCENCVEELRDEGRVKVEFEKEVVGSGVQIGVNVSGFVLVCSFVCVWCQVVYLTYCNKIIVWIRRRHF